MRRVVRHRNLRNGDNSVIAEFEHSYNRANDRLFEKRLHDIDGFGRPKGETYGYDSLYRVVDFREGRLDTSNNVISGTETETQNWTLDGVGNWATTVQDGVTKNQTVTSLNEYSSFGGVANTFDENGDYVDDGQFLYKWDFLNRLREVRLKSSGALLAVYAYDAVGRRARRETTASANVGAGVERYFYDGAQCIEERTGADLVKRQYVVGGLDEWLILDRDTNGDGVVDTSNFYHHNALGSVVALTDATAAVVERYTYSAYGKPLFENPDNTPAGSQVQSAFGNPHLFAGYRFDPEAGLSHVRNRYLHHGQGRWLSRDPIPSANLYEYVNGSPANGTDPSGEIVELSCEEERTLGEGGKERLLRELETLAEADPGTWRWEGRRLAKAEGSGSRLGRFGVGEVWHPEFKYSLSAFKGLLARLAGYERETESPEFQAMRRHMEEMKARTEYASTAMTARNLGFRTTAFSLGVGTVVVGTGGVVLAAAPEVASASGIIPWLGRLLAGGRTVAAAGIKWVATRTPGVVFRTGIVHGHKILGVIIVLGKGQHFRAMLDYGIKQGGHINLEINKWFNLHLPRDLVRLGEAVIRRFGF